MDVGNNIKKGGLYVIGRMLIGDIRDLELHSEILKEQKIYENFLHDRNSNIKGFSEVLISPNVRQGISNLVTV